MCFLIKWGRKKPEDAVREPTYHDVVKSKAFDLIAREYDLMLEEYLEKNVEVLLAYQQVRDLAIELRVKPGLTEADRERLDCIIKKYEWASAAYIQAAIDKGQKPVSFREFFKDAK